MRYKRYYLMSLISLIIAIIASCLYLPYFFKAFNIKGFDWLDIAPDLFKTNYIDVLIYFGIFLLIGTILINMLTMFSNPGLSRVIFKLSTIIALMLPTLYTLALKYDWALSFWIKNVSSHVKMISYIFILVSVGTFILGLIFNFTKRKNAKLNVIFESLIMCAILILLVAVNGWCGWAVNSTKLFGVLMSLFVINSLLMAIIDFIYAKKYI